MNTFVMNTRRIASVAALSTAAFLGGCASTVPQPIDKLANSHALAECTVKGLAPILREEFLKIVDIMVSAAGNDPSVTLGAYSSMEQSIDKVSLDCLGAVTGVPLPKKGSRSYQADLKAVFDRYIDGNAYDSEMLKRVPDLQMELMNEAFGIPKIEMK